ncbi:MULTISPECIES: glycosyltransferase family 4 protein [unclassified Leeuwenhoekiella]|uniref:glycosyltransferase family 4 protein n=1 Tax=unclassified Leeuwenhoekiella TaxID=2615029 RepID=UPI000C3BBD6A|nr:MULTISPECIES: glycosyltransferase family 4 protein [unclassified Leeuwenhoekiella]MAW97092.1 hypothetical protein [Leeuwenhoekiella sp.]MBA82608.1 hypothetical protein [Leeuwenhoekiella sp.]
MKKLIFLNSHPIQYFAPLYKFLNGDGINCSVWYCSSETLNLKRDQQFGVKIKWDIPLLDGYRYKFFKNYSFKPSIFNGFLGLMNFGVIRELFKEKDAAIVVHGYHYLTHFLVLLLGRFSKNKICLRLETPQSQESKNSNLKRALKSFFLRRIIFSGVDTFLYIGNQNKEFYQRLGVQEHQLVFCPYAVDNERFSKSFLEFKDQRDCLKERNGIEPNQKVILYSGKYIQKKRPLDLLEAFHALNNPEVWLVMVGEGEYREKLEKTILEKHIKNVLLTGFINQSKITEYYSLADVFVMCSGNGETWGLSTNEAMNFDLPIIVSDRTGCVADLVMEGVNGYSFQLGNIQELTNKLKLVIEKDNLTYQISSREIIKNYSFSTISTNLKKLLNVSN